MTTRISRSSRIFSDGFYSTHRPDAIRCGGCGSEVPVALRREHAATCVELQRLSRLVDNAVARKHQDAPPKARHSSRGSASRGFRFNW